MVACGGMWWHGGMVADMMISINLSIFPPDLWVHRGRRAEDGNARQAECTENEHHYASAGQAAAAVAKVEVRLVGGSSQRWRKGSRWEVLGRVSVVRMRTR